MSTSIATELPGIEAEHVVPEHEAPSNDASTVIEVMSSWHCDGSGCPDVTDDFKASQQSFESFGSADIV